MPRIQIFPVQDALVMEHTVAEVANVLPAFVELAPCDRPLIPLSQCALTSGIRAPRDIPTSAKCRFVTKMIAIVFVFMVKNPLSFTAPTFRAGFAKGPAEIAGTTLLIGVTNFFRDPSGDVPRGLPWAATKAPTTTSSVVVCSQ